MNNYTIELHKKISSSDIEKTYNIYVKYLAVLKILSKQDIFNFFNNKKYFNVDGLTIYKNNNLLLETIISIITNYFNTTLENINNNYKSRKREHLYPRQMIHYYAFKYIKKSQSYIGEIVGKKDHATVLHSFRSIRDLNKTDKLVQNDVKKLDVLFKNYIEIRQ